MKKLLITLGVGLLCASTSFAVPSLQLDIGTVQNGTFARSGLYGGNEDILSAGPSFTLRALSDSGSARYYYISASIVPQVSSPPPNFGSFTIGGNTYSASQNMQFGIPPIASVDTLQRHGIFPTYYGQFRVNWNDNRMVNSYNTQDGTAGPSGQRLFYTDFLVDVSGLLGNYEVHFDLYAVNSAGQIVGFAPFSHDATSAPDGGATLAMLGFALVGAETLRRRIARK